MIFNIKKVNTKRKIGGERGVKETNKLKINWCYCKSK